MIDIELLKNQLGNSYVFTQYEKSILVNIPMRYFDGSDEGFVISIGECKDGIILTDIGLTYSKLTKREYDLNDEDLSEYKKRVLYTFSLGYGPSNELFTIVKDSQQVVLAIGRLVQAMTLLAYIDMQYDEEE